MHPIHLLDVTTIEPFCGTCGDDERWSFTADREKVTCPACDLAIREDRTAASRWAAQSGAIVRAA